MGPRADFKLALRGMRRSPKRERGRTPASMLPRSRFLKLHFPYSPGGATERSQGWSVAKPLERFPRFRSPGGEKAALAPPGLQEIRTADFQGFRSLTLAPPLATFGRPSGATKKAQLQRPRFSPRRPLRLSEARSIPCPLPPAPRPPTAMIDPTAATNLLLRLLAVEGITGQEKNIARTIQTALKEAGVAPRNIRVDDVNTRIPVPTESGNVIAELPGTAAGPRLLFMTHMDTVPLCAGAVPVRKGNRIVPKGETALGGDNRTGCAVLVTLAATLIKHKLPHPPLTLLFTVREESGLYGARHVDPKV